MNFEEALKALKEGEKVRRKSWIHICYLKLDSFGLEIYVDGKTIPYVLGYDDLNAQDWEVVEE